MLFVSLKNTGCDFLTPFFRVDRLFLNRAMLSAVSIFLLCFLAFCGNLHPVTSAATPETGGAGDLNIYQLLDRYRYYNFLSAIDFAGLGWTLKTSQTLTVFVPTNAAFDSIGQDLRNYYIQNPKIFQNIMKYHIAEGIYYMKNLQDEQTFATMDDSAIARFNIYNHTNLANISTYSGAKIVDGNFTATNGIIHIIDRLLDFTAIPTRTTLDFIKDQPDFFFNLTRIINAADQKEMLALLNDTANPHTFFAPNNYAIANLQGDTFNKILANKALATSVIKHHITKLGTYYTAGLIDGEVIPIISNSSTIVSITGNSYKLDNRANLVTINNATTSGVVHTVDVLLWFSTELE